MTAKPTALILQFRLSASISHVFNHLTNHDLFVAVHPVIFRMDELGFGRYRVHETLRFLFLPFTFTYPVVITPAADKNSVQIKAIVFKITTIHMQFALTPQGSETLVQETISIQSPLPLVWLMNRIFRKQHGQLFRNIEAAAGR